MEQTRILSVRHPVLGDEDTCATLTKVVYQTYKEG